LTNFAKTGDPNGAGLPEWPRYGKDDLLIHLDSTITSGPDAERPRYEFLLKACPRRSELDWSIRDINMAALGAIFGLDFRKIHLKYLLSCLRIMNLRVHSRSCGNPAVTTGGIVLVEEAR